jgi:hypothetical protein
MALDDDTPPSAPAALEQTAQSNTTVSISWTPAQDQESGIKHYKVFVNGALHATANGPEATVSGLSRNTSYEVTVSAVNWADLESSQSAPLGIQTADLDCQTSQIFLRASAADLENGMQTTTVNGSINSEVIYGVEGSTSSAQDSHSKARFTVTIPSDGEYWAWFRTQYAGDQTNSWWISVDGGAEARITNGDTFGSWHWEGHMSDGGVSLGTLSAGAHELLITAREPGADNVLDIICITSEQSFTPSDGDICFNDATPARRGASAGSGGVHEHAVGAQRIRGGVRITGAAPGALIELIGLDGAVVARLTANASGEAAARNIARGSYLLRIGSNATGRIMFKLIH